LLKTPVLHRLLNHYHIFFKKPITPYHHTINQGLAHLTDQLQAGKTMDCLHMRGTPGISDPLFVGESMLNKILKLNACLAQLPSFLRWLIRTADQHFCFEGFLPLKKGATALKLGR